MSENSMLFKQQFLLSNKKITIPEEWKELSFFNYNLYAHPTLNVHIKSEKNMGIVLVGYAFDYKLGQITDQEMIDNLFSKLDDFNQFIEYLDVLSGRYVLIIKNKNSMSVFNDPCGLRSVFYTNNKDSFLVGSQPGIISKFGDVKKSKRYEDFYNSNYVKNNKEYRIPSGISLYPEINHLIPNHYLNLERIEQIRFWPRQKITNKPTKEIIFKSKEILSKQMKIANNRFNLSLGITAGLDSRTILAASKDIKKDLNYHTLIHSPNLNDDKSKSSRIVHSTTSRDFNLAKEILHSQGLPHNIYKINKTPGDESTDFKNIYIQNCSMLHLEANYERMYNLLDYDLSNKTAVVGNASEIVRYPYDTHEEINTYEQIVDRVQGWDELDFVAPAISNWFNSAKQVAELHNIDILDLYHWEHTAGSWLSQAQLEFDIVWNDVVTPFNNRELLETMLSSSPDTRKNSELHLGIINKSWPELLEVPINPKTIPEVTIDKIKNILRSVGLLDYVRSIKNRKNK